MIATGEPMGRLALLKRYGDLLKAAGDSELKLAVRPKRYYVVEISAAAQNDV